MQSYILSYLDELDIAGKNDFLGQVVDLLEDIQAGKYDDLPKHHKEFLEEFYTLCAQHVAPKPTIYDRLQEEVKELQLKFAVL